MTNPHIDAFLQSVNVSGLRIVAPTDRIFFCGGPYEANSNTPCFSARDFILRRTLVNEASLFKRFHYEEQMREWLNGGHFADLHNLEKHIAEISSVVFLIAESPGSYAELGSFASSKTIVDKMFVVTNTAIDDEKSYISLGPLSFLRNVDPEKVRTYPWGSAFKSGNSPTVDTDDLDGIADDIIAKLLEFEKQNASEQKLEPEFDGHISLLIIDLIRLYGACMTREITTGLSTLIDVGGQSTVRKHLFLLEKLGLIRQHKHGGTYYVATSPIDHITYDFIEGTSRDIADRVRLTMDVRSWFKDNDKHRFNVIRRHGVGSNE